MFDIRNLLVYLIENRLQKPGQLITAIINSTQLHTHDFFYIVQLTSICTEAKEKNQKKSQ